MVANDHQKVADFIWSIANKLRGPYRPPQYRKVMLPLIVLRRLDWGAEPNLPVVTATKILARMAKSPLSGAG